MDSWLHKNQQHEVPHFEHNIAQIILISSLTLTEDKIQMIHQFHLLAMLWASLAMLWAFVTLLQAFVVVLQAFFAMPQGLWSYYKPFSPHRTSKLCCCATSLPHHSTKHYHLATSLHCSATSSSTMLQASFTMPQASSTLPLSICHLPPSLCLLHYAGNIRYCASLAMQLTSFVVTLLVYTLAFQCWHNKMEKREKEGIEDETPIIYAFIIDEWNTRWYEWITIYHPKWKNQYCWRHCICNVTSCNWLRQKQIVASIKKC